VQPPSRTQAKIAEMDDGGAHDGTGMCDEERVTAAIQSTPPLEWFSSIALDIPRLKCVETPSNWQASPGKSLPKLLCKIVAKKVLSFPTRMCYCIA
jgi:hypothetical protein